MAHFVTASEERAYLRRVARVLALKALFESDLSPHLPDEALERMIANVPVDVEGASLAADGPPSLAESGLNEPVSPQEEGEPPEDESWLAGQQQEAPAVAVSFGGAEEEAGQAGEPLAQEEPGGEEPALDDEEPAASGPMEPLSGEQAARVEGFARSLVRGVEAKKAEIDGIIAEVAPQWPLADLPVVDRNLLRIAIHEVVYAAHTPVRAAINEAVDLAAEYGGETSPRFVNGVLGTVARRYGTRHRV